MRRLATLRFSPFAAFLLAGVALSSPAPAQQRDWVNPDVLDLREQVDRLQREVDRMRGGGAVSAGGTSGGAVSGGASLSGDSYVRLDQLEVALRTLTGKLERLEYGVRQTIQERDLRILDLEYRLQVLEAEFGGPPPQQPRPFTESLAGGGFSAPGQAIGADASRYTGGTDASRYAGGAGVGVGTQGGAVEGGLLSGAGTPPTILGEIPADSSGGAIVDQPRFDSGGQVASSGVSSGVAPSGAQSVGSGGAGGYQEAIANIRAGAYDQAEGQLRGFIAASPQDPRVGEATFWLGEISYVRGQYDVAAKTFLESFRSYPDSPKAPDSLLKLGMTLAQMNQKSEACLTFNEVAARYPDAAASVLRHADLEARRAGCQ